jgi:hypothetical protein
MAKSKKNEKEWRSSTLCVSTFFFLAEQIKHNPRILAMHNCVAF